MNNSQGLENLTLWLWDNADEGLHITMTTNYNLPTEKRWFFSYAGAQTLNSWRAYDRNQPEAFRDWFRMHKTENKSMIRGAQDAGYDVYISKQAKNTGTKGRVVAQGYCATFMPKHQVDTPQFFLQMANCNFKGEFDPSAISNKQRERGCLGVYTWSATEEHSKGVSPW